MADGSPRSTRYESDRPSLMMAIIKHLDEMGEVGPEVTQAVHRRIKRLCANPEIPRPFREMALLRARSLDCDAHMRAIGETLAQAIRLADEGRMLERGATIAEARTLYARACAMGVSDQFRRSTGWLIDIVTKADGSASLSLAAPLHPHHAA